MLGRNVKEAPGGNLKVSIVVPAFNDEEYIERSLGSCLRQTHANLEIVCVDDGSTDGTRAAQQAFAAKDDRVKLMPLDHNQGTHNARRAGVAQATGDLVMFLDADDELAPQAAARAAAEFATKPYDILHFATAVKSDGGKVGRDRVKLLEDWTCPVKGELRGRDILEKSFVEHAYSFSLACKAYPLPLVQRAFDHMGDVWADSGEDALEYFAVAFFADVYRGLPHCKYYVYHLGDGLSEHRGLTAEEFERVIRLHDAVEGIRTFLQGEGALGEDGQGESVFDGYDAIFQAHWLDQLQVTLRNWYNDVREEDKPACLRRILETWPREQAIDEACKLGSGAVAVLQDVLGEDALTSEQLMAAGRADGEREVREEYERSLSYRLGRTLSAPVRLMRR